MRSVPAGPDPGDPRAPAHPRGAGRPRRRARPAPAPRLLPGVRPARGLRGRRGAPGAPRLAAAIGAGDLQRVTFTYCISGSCTGHRLGEGGPGRAPRQSRGVGRLVRCHRCVPGGGARSGSRSPRDKAGLPLRFSQTLGLLCKEKLSSPEE